MQYRSWLEMELRKFKNAFSVYWTFNFHHIPFFKSPFLSEINHKIFVIQFLKVSKRIFRGKNHISILKNVEFENWDDFPMDFKKSSKKMDWLILIILSYRRLNRKIRNFNEKFKIQFVAWKICRKKVFFGVTVRPFLNLYYQYYCHFALLMHLYSHL